jgi:hypothetical protein
MWLVRNKWQGGTQEVTLYTLSIVTCCVPPCHVSRTNPEPQPKTRIHDWDARFCFDIRADYYILTRLHDGWT